MASSRNEPESQDPEIAAIGRVNAALLNLDASAQTRVLRYVIQKFSLGAAFEYMPGERAPRHSPDEDVAPPEMGTATEPSAAEDLDGISPIAQRWIRRSGLKVGELSSLFSLGVDEIDLIASSVPGDTKKDRMRSVFLLKGMAAYLGGGVARITHEQVKEACLHYDAFDSPNFARSVRQFAAEIGGSKEDGYTLTPRGLTAATELVRQIVQDR
jgi:hypothetical protein